MHNVPGCQLDSQRTAKQFVRSAPLHLRSTGHLAIIRFAAEFDVLIESVFPAPTRKPANISSLFHLLCSFQVGDGFVDGLDQRP
jgi:hypothetical protein